jgi:membrane fusion protein, multidrug efflux system
MRIPRLIVGGAAMAVSAGVLALILFSNQPLHGANAAGAGRDQPPGGLSVSVAAVVKRAVPVYLDYVATAEAIHSVTLQAKVTGYLVAQGAADGANVKEGDLLYRIDPRDYQAALDQARAQAQRDEAQRDYAQASAHRNQSLSKNGDVSLDTYQQALSSLHQFEAALAADRAGIETAQLNLGYTEIRAAFAGRLSRSLVHEGALINAAGTQLNTLVQLDPIYLSFNPPETDLAAIAQAQSQGPVPAEVTVGRDPKARFSGTLSFLDNRVDHTTGTIAARATIANPQQSLVPGQYARVRLQVGQQSDALLIPQVAVGSSQLGRFVYVVGKDQKVEQRVVTLGRTLGDLIVVEQGLAEGDPVIVGNLQKLRPGVPVTPLPPQGAGGA